MSILCERCGREYDVTLFSFAGTVRCECGAEVRLDSGHVVCVRPEPKRASCRGKEEIARGADRIVDMILRHDRAEVDIAIAIERLRDRAEELFPDRGELFAMVYESRFERLAAQWRDRP